MTTIAIVPDNPQDSPTRFRAVAGEAQSVGATVGQALDALRAQLGGPEQTTLVVVQPMRPDELFTAVQQQRLAELMARWRAARDAGTTLPPQEQAELDALVEAELRAAGARSAVLVSGHDKKGHHESHELHEQERRQNHSEAAAIRFCLLLSFIRVIRVIRGFS